MNSTIFMLIAFFICIFAEIYAIIILAMDINAETGFFDKIAKCFKALFWKR
jgi:hypothetical protein